MACFLPLGPGLAHHRARLLLANSLSWKRVALAKSETLLVVDDNLDNIEILRAFLESRGYNVVSAQDGRSALEKLEEIRPALVLLDVMMPGMDGWQVCRTIKAHPDYASIRVMMVTAKGGFEDKYEGMRSGADDYVVKPVDLNELAEKVERNLAASGGKRT
jgi:CheY-like chemotaxis protein